MIDLNRRIPGAENFKYREFVKSSTATRKGISNIPNQQQLKNIENLAINVLQPLRDEFGGIRISSGFRSVELNEYIGGSPNSNHCRGEAADIEPLSDNVSLLDLVEFIYNNLEFRTIILEYPDDDGWVHVDYRDGGNIKRLKLKDSTHNYSVVSLKNLIEMY